MPPRRSRLCPRAARHCPGSSLHHLDLLGARIGARGLEPEGRSHRRRQHRLHIGRPLPSLSRGALRLGGGSGGGDCKLCRRSARRRPRAPLVLLLLLLLLEPLVQPRDEAGDHPERFQLAHGGFLRRRQIFDLVPRDLADLLLGAGLEHGGLWHVGHDIQPHHLLLPLQLEELVLVDECGAVEADLLVHLADRAADLVLVLVDLPLGEPP
mmetsp:Transcript_12051/g.29859  ORF Transcript_12051/g.29859 Transcript_12051/m.29859 type:complete len:210 (+) Transcript_12051:114-743(+)